LNPNDKKHSGEEKRWAIITTMHPLRGSEAKKLEGGADVKGGLGRKHGTV